MVRPGHHKRRAAAGGGGGYEYPRTGLLAEYLFSGNADDTSGNGYDATVTGASLTTDRYGTANSAYSLNGSSDHIRIDDPSIIKTATAGSIVAWVKPAGIGSFMSIFGAGYSGGTADFIAFAIDSGGKFTLYQRNDGDTTDNLLSDDVLFSIGTEYFVVITSDGSQYKLYVDSVLKNMTVITGTNSGDWFGDITTPDVDLFDWGVIHQGGINYWHFNGIIDDGLIYETALTQSEITDIYNGSKP